jgi:coenzyme F420-0:L-glutamate ligase / coenzyme F420-1:gamma-L-glutamate ligase
MTMTLKLIPVKAIPLVREGDDLGQVIADALAAEGTALQDGDIVVLAQKIVSKAEGRQVSLSTVTPSAKALKLAQEVNKDPRMVELILSESNAIVRQARDVLIVDHKLGFVHANAGIDQSNVEGEDEALLLPVDSDASARALRSDFQKRYSAKVGVIIADSFGRAWRKGTVGVAIGASGVDTLLNMRGENDLVGRKLEITEIGRADELAAAAGLVMGQADEGIPVAIIRGLTTREPQDSVQPLLRKPEEDLFR